MKILVTGATGFIGRHVVSWLVDHNYDVVATSTSEEKAKKMCWYDSVAYMPCDYYTEKLDYFNFFDCPDILIHLAWKDAFVNSVKNQMELNLPANICFISSFIDKGAIKIVGLGSSQEYGLLSGCISESAIGQKPIPYGVAKDTLRRYIETAADEYGFNWNWIRQFYVSGDGQNPNSLFGQLQQAVANGYSVFKISDPYIIRDYLDIKIAAENICKLSLQKKGIGVVNNCSGKPIMLIDAIKEYLCMKQSELELIFESNYSAQQICQNQWGNTLKLREYLSYYNL